MIVFFKKLFTENCILKVKAAVPAEDSKAKHIYDLVKNQNNKRRKSRRARSRSRSRGRRCRNNQTNNGSSYQSKRFSPPPRFQNTQLPSRFQPTPPPLQSQPPFLPMPTPNHQPMPFQISQHTQFNINQVFRNYQNTLEVQKQFMNMNMNPYPQPFQHGHPLFSQISQHYTSSVSRNYPSLISQHYQPPISQNNPPPISQSYQQPICHIPRNVLAKTPPPPCLNKPAKLAMDRSYDQEIHNKFKSSVPSESNFAQNTNAQNDSALVDRSKTPDDQGSESVDSCSTVIIADKLISSSATSSSKSGSGGPQPQSQPKYKIPILIHTKTIPTSNEQPTGSNKEPPAVENTSKTYVPPKMTEIIKCEFRRKAALAKNKEKMAQMKNKENESNSQEIESISSGLSAALSEMNISGSNASQSGGYDSGDEAIPSLAAVKFYSDFFFLVIVLLPRILF